MARRKKTGARTKSGRLSRAYQGPARDNGTSEVQGKRKLMVGEADPALAASAIGILLAHQHIDREQHDKALEYRKLWCARFGTPGLGNSFGTEASDKRLLKLKEDFERLERKITPEEREVLCAVAVFDQIPVWFDVRRLGLKILPEDNLQHDLLIGALNGMLERRKPLVGTKRSLDTRYGQAYGAKCA